MRVTQLPGLRVIDSRLARQAGVVTDVIVDTRNARLAFMEARHGGGWAAIQIPPVAVHRIHSGIVSTHDTAELELARPRVIEDYFVNLEALVGLEVLAESGDRVGYLVDAHMHPKTLDIQAYELRRPFWDRWLRRSRIRPHQVLACSPAVMIVHAHPMPRGQRAAAGAPGHA